MPQLDSLNLFYVFFCFLFFFFFFYFVFIRWFFFPLSYCIKMKRRFYLNHLDYNKTLFLNFKMIDTYHGLFDVYLFVLNIHLLYSYCYTFFYFFSKFFVQTPFEVSLFFFSINHHKFL